MVFYSGVGGVFLSILSGFTITITIIVTNHIRLHHVSQILWPKQSYPLPHHFNYNLPVVLCSIYIHNWSKWHTTPVWWVSTFGKFNQGWCWGYLGLLASSATSVSLVRFRQDTLLFCYSSELFTLSYADHQRETLPFISCCRQLLLLCWGLWRSSSPILYRRVEYVQLEFHSTPKHLCHQHRQALVMAEVPNSLALSGSSLVVLSVLAFALEHPILSVFARVWPNKAEISIRAANPFTLDLDSASFYVRMRIRTLACLFAHLLTLLYTPVLQKTVGDAWKEWIWNLRSKLGNNSWTIVGKNPGKAKQINCQWWFIIMLGS